ncbi:methyltransferase domain-containing protein [Microbacterium esteraromaticum]|uniref:methyltransferase domain-containing protein n=1 Tax=Microbacterium esteraromaticum TaxID=57043 RepID=UPI0021752E8D|nr:methyltransferase domain-containing protein [Microbacterium esteraromaticum]
MTFWPDLATAVTEAAATGRLVAIDGVDGSGKTRFAANLAAHIVDRPVIIIHADDFLNPSRIRHARGRHSELGFWEDTYDYPALRRDVLEPLQRGGDGHYRPVAYDARADEPIVGDTLHADPAALVLVEGMFLLRDELASHWDASIHLHVPFAVTASRMAIRDGSHPDPEHPSMRRYVGGQRLYFAAARPWERADFVVDNSDFDHPQLIDASPADRTTPRRHHVAASSPDVLAGSRRSRRVTEAIGAAYDARAAEYVALLGDIAQTDARDRALIAAWRDATPGRLLDAGCGPGLWTRFLHDGGRDVLGVDLSEQFIGHAREKHPDLEFHHGSFAALPLADASLGGILAWYSLIHTPPEQLPGILAEFARVVAPGGSILIGFFDGTPGEPFDHAVTTAYFWTPDALAPLLVDAGLTLTAVERRGRTPDEPSTRPHASLTAVRT